MADRIFNIVFAVCIAVPLIVTLVMQTRTSVLVNAHVEEMIYESKTGDARRNHDPLNLPDIENHRRRDGALKPGYRAFASADQITHHRQISLSTFLRIQDFLRPGEAPPKPENEDLFMNARVGLFAQLECDRIEVALAARCHIANSRAHRTKDGLFKIHATFDFIQRDGIGTYDPERPLFYDEVTVRLPEGGQNFDAGTPKNAARQRSLIYAAIRDKCRAIKKLEGTCALNSLRLSTQQRDGSFAQSARADFSFLRPRDTSY